MTQQRAMPATEPLVIAKQPKLQPSGGRGLRIGGNGEESQPNGPEAGSDDVVTPGRRDATGAKKAAPARRGRTTQQRPAPRAADAVALTVRHDPTEAQELDFFVLELREETGRRVDKAEIVRELLRAAREDDRVRRVLVRRLKG
ncbi:hypothetical protein ACIQWA_40630 [Kitasatospora sp. NPDC098652]|uniref:hypothetical protein n=1 Tax=Kitasatospora sp. NPDC098652 TaxID=3364095 RepID=UPI0038202A69